MHEYYVGTDTVPDSRGANIVWMQPGPVRQPAHLTAPIERIAERFKGTYDIAGVADALYQSPERASFTWSNFGNFETATTQDDLYAARRMSCYEFVHFVAYLGGQQGLLSGGQPKLRAGDRSVYPRTGATAWKSMDVIPRGKVVMGVAYAFNNAGGYYHVGISLGNNMIINLSSNGNLNVRPVNEVFGFGYSTILVADYNWETAQFDSAGPRPTPFLQPHGDAFEHAKDNALKLAPMRAGRLF